MMIADAAGGGGVFDLVFDAGQEQGLDQLGKNKKRGW